MSKFNRKQEIVALFLAELDKHLMALKNGELDEAIGIKELSNKLFIDPNHLSDTVKSVLGKSPCKIYEEKLMDLSKQLLINTQKSISEIAFTFSYAPSQFSRFFKRYTNTTPTAYRNKHIS